MATRDIAFDDVLPDGTPIMMPQSRMHRLQRSKGFRIFRAVWICAYVAGPFYMNVGPVWITAALVCAGVLTNLVRICARVGSSPKSYLILRVIFEMVKIGILSQWMETGDPNLLFGIYLALLWETITYFGLGFKLPRVILFRLQRGILDILWVLFGVFLIIYVFAFVATYLWSAEPPSTVYNGDEFATIGNSMITMMGLSGWFNGEMIRYFNDKYPGSVIFFLLYWLCINMGGMSLLVAVIVDRMTTQAKK